MAFLPDLTPSRPPMSMPIAPSGTYQFDDLLELDAIKALEGEPVYKFLTIFDSGNVKAFNEFRASNGSFFEESSMCLVWAP